MEFVPQSIAAMRSVIGARLHARPVGPPGAERSSTSSPSGFTPGPGGQRMARPARAGT